MAGLARIVEDTAMVRQFSAQRGLRNGTAGALRVSRRWVAARVGAAAILAIAVAPAFGDVSVFASAPAPGHPFGIAVGDDRVYVSTSAGDFFAGHQNSDDERVFT